MNRKLSYICSGAILLAGCSSLPGVENREFEVLSVENADTRISFDGTKALWNTGDPVSVFYKSPENEIWTYSGEDGSSCGTLKHFISSGRKETGSTIYAVYPYWEGASLDGSVLKTVIACETAPAPRPLLAAKTETQSLFFNYLTPVFRFTLEGPAEVSEISLEGMKGEKIAGECSVDFSGETPSLSGASLTEVRMVVPQVIPAGSSLDFHFTAAPAEFEDGYKYTVKYSDGSEEIFRVTPPLKAEAGRMYVSRGTPLSSSDPSVKVIDVCISDGVTRYFPSKDGPFNFNEGMNGPYEYEGYQYSIYIAAGASEKRVTAGGGLRINGGGYILLPAIPDSKLVKLTVGIKYDLDMSIVPDGQPSRILAGTSTFIPANSLREFALEDTEVNTRYRLNILNEISASGIFTIKLYYKSCKN